MYLDMSFCLRLKIPSSLSSEVPVPLLTAFLLPEYVVRLLMFLLLGCTLSLFVNGDKRLSEV